jgi:outer membrane protein assembly factor BamB/tetratricopeptide (TPR) repeat protein
VNFVVQVRQPFWRARVRAACFVWLVGASCALAQDVCTNDQPAAINAIVEPDAEVNFSLLRITMALRSGNPDRAISLLLEVLRTRPEAMVSTNGVVFRPARKVAFDLLRTLPERTLAVYRLQQNVSERNPVRTAPMDAASLEAMYRKGIPGPATAAAGLRLAGLLLDQARFRDARRVLLDLLDESPGAGVPRSELLARLLVACARVGDAAEAERAWVELQKSGDTERWSSLGAELRPAAASPSNAWTMAYGGPSRDGVSGLGCPDPTADDAWVIRWGTNLDPGAVRGTPGDGVRTNLPPQFSLSRGYAAACMTDRRLRPAAEPIFSGNRAWINGFDALALIELDTGRDLQCTAHASETAPERAAAFTVQMSRGASPGAAEAWVFGNRLNRAASLVRGRVYCVEENYRASLDADVWEQQNEIEEAYAKGQQPCGNALAAYDAGTGSRLWRVGREVAAAASEPKTQRPWRANGIRFAAAPVPCAGLLLAPVEDDGGLSVVGLDADCGSLVWWTRLTDAFPFGPPRAAPLTITVDGAQAYLSDGNGSVSALDGGDGSALWTALYETWTESSSTNAGSAEITKADVPTALAGPTLPANPETWEESLVLVTGETVVAMPEGSQQILAFDRRRGTRLWTRGKPEGVDYVVGRQGASVIVAGGRTVACLDVTDGRERWRMPLAGSTGRGTLYGCEVLIPCGREILRLRAADGTALGSLRAQTMDGLPLGNLYVNGEQLLVAGPERLYALVSARRTLARLDERLMRNPTADAYAERGKLKVVLGRYTEAVADFREARKRQRGGGGEDPVRSSLLSALWHAAEQDAGAAQASYAEALEVAATVAERAESIWRQAQHRERTGDTNGALTLYTALVTGSGVTISPNLDNPNWEVSAPRLASRRIRTLTAGDARGLALLEEPASNALARLGPAPACTALVEVATVFAGTAAGRDAALKAAQVAVDHGDLGTAEVILQRSLALSKPSGGSAITDALLHLYERMHWPSGVVKLCNDWPRLFAGGRVPENLERAAMKAADQRTATAVAPPPWRLRWRKKLAPSSTLQIIPAGLFYRTQDGKQMACLALDTGLPRWQMEGDLNVAMDGRMLWDETSVVSMCASNSTTILDLWSGASTTNALLRPDPAIRYHRYPVLSEVGLAGVGSQTDGSVLTSVDMLTGQVVWRRREMETLQGAGVLPVPLAYAPTGVFLMRCEPNGDAAFLTLDPWTGDVAFSRPLTSNARLNGLSASQGGMWTLTFPRTPEREIPVITNQVLSVRDRRTGTVLWTTPPDLAISKLQGMPNGTVLAETTNHTALLFDGGNGRILCRSHGDPFSFDYGVQGMGNDAVIASRRMDGGTNEEVLVLDPHAGSISPRWRLNAQARPLSAFGPGRPDQLLVHVQGKLAVHAQGGNARWRLPRNEDIGGDAPASANYTPLFADGLILMVNSTSGDVLAYEHDPEGEGTSVGESGESSLGDAALQLTKPLGR